MRRQRSAGDSVRITGADLWFISSLSLVISLAIFCWLRNTHPPADTKALEKGAHVIDRMSSLLEGIDAHPVGTRENGIVRDRIVGAFRAKGLTPRIESGFTCAPSGSCGRVENIVASLKSGRPGAPLLVAAHYDSAPAGPGAGDDMLAVASILEAVSVLQSRPLVRDVVFLIADGEEAGLLGARSFVERHAASEFFAVLNFEARGTSGPLLMFETSEEDVSLVTLYQRAARWPATGSLFAAVYERLPNDTDFTVFKNAGFAGLNFAIVGDVQHYHTPLDRPSSIDLRTAAQYATESERVIAGFASATTPIRNGRATYFDMLQLVMLRWPPWVDLAILAIAFLLTAGATWRLVRRTSSAAVVKSGLITLIIFAGAVSVAWMVGALFSRGGDPWPVDARPGLLALLTAICALLVITPGVLRERAAGGFVVSAAIIVTCISAIVLVVLPGGGYVAVVPALVLAVAAFARTARGGAPAAFIATGITGSLLLTLAPKLYDALGFGASVLIAIFLFFTAAPLLALTPSSAVRRIASAILLLAAAVTAVIQIRQPHATADHPHKVNVVVVAEGPTTFAVSRAYSQEKKGFRSPDDWELGASPFAWSGSRWFRHQRSWDRAIALPEVAIRQSSPRAWQLRIRSMRSADRAAFSVADGSRVKALRLNGVSIDPANATSAGGHIRVVNRTHSSDPTVIDVEVSGTEPLDVVIEDEKFEHFDDLRSRLGTQYQDGDLSIARRVITIR